MQDVLLSLANWLMLEKCKEQEIDPSSSHVKKVRTRRGEHTYTLVKEGVNRPIMQVTFARSNAPRFIW